MVSIRRSSFVSNHDLIQINQIPILKLTATIIFNGIMSSITYWFLRRKYKTCTVYIHIIKVCNILGFLNKHYARRRLNGIVQLDAGIRYIFRLFVLMCLIIKDIIVYTSKTFQVEMAYFRFVWHIFWTLRDTSNESETDNPIFGLVEFMQVWKTVLASH